MIERATPAISRSMRNLVLPALLLAASSPILLVAAVSCSCFNGHPVSSSSCECACDAGYMQPTCTFGVTDSVGIAFSLNVTAEEFVAELFTNAVAYIAAADATFLWAKNVTRFQKVRAAVAVPGYTVSRLLESVSYRDPWVAEFGVVSAHVITPPTGDAQSSFIDFDMVLYESGNMILTLNSIMWIVGGIVLVLLLVGIENGLTHNDEHVVQPSALKHRRSQSMRNMNAKRPVTNLNEHRRKAPPPSMSLPEQILDDFVDSDDDVPHTKTHKYSLGSKSQPAARSLGGRSSPDSPTNNRKRR